VSLFDDRHQLSLVEVALPPSSNRGTSACG
jgi:hypothetical protein